MTDKVKFLVIIDTTKCNDCYECIDTCPEQALILDYIMGHIKWIPDDCSRCEQCNDICDALHTTMWE